MRLLDLHLKAYGPFTDRRLDLSGGGEGLHVVFGNNEAGKSSALRALKALLYGIPARTDDKFLHPYDQLRIGARLLLADGRELAVLRKKGTKATLLDPETEEPLDEGLLARCLQGMEEGVFSSTFGIDHRALREGGRELEEQKGDVAQALFAAGLGTRNLRSVLQQLDKEAEGLFAPRGTNRTINRAVAELEAAKKELREATVSGRDWEERSRRRDDARRELAEVQAELEGARRERHRLQRMQRVLPLLARRGALRTEREALGAVVLLPAGFGAERRDLAAEIRTARASHLRASAERASLAQERAAVLPGSGVLEHAEDVEQLQQELGRYKKGLADRSRLLSERSDARAAAQGLLDETWPDLPLDEAEALRPALSRWPRVQELAPRREALTRDGEQARRALAEAERRLQSTREALAALPERRDPAALRAAVEAARRAGDLEAETAQAAARVRTEEERARRELDRLPWAGTLEDLEALPVPPAAAIQRFEAAFTSLAERERSREEERRKLRAELDDAERQLDAIRREGSVPSEEELAEARERRERSWSALRESWEEAEAETYERHVEAADEIADRLRREAGRVHEAAGQSARREALVRRLAELDRDTEAAAAERERLDGDWRDLWRPCRIDPRPPGEMHPDWTARHARLLERAEDLRTLREKRETLEAAASRHRTALARELTALELSVPPNVETPRGASPRSRQPRDNDDLQKASSDRPLQGDGIPSEGDAPRGVSTVGRDAVEAGAVPLDRLLARCDGIVRELEEVERRRAAHLAELRTLEETLAEATDARDRAAAALDDWRAAWAEAVRDFGLPKEALPGEASQRHDQLLGLFAQLKTARDLDRRIAGLERDTEVFQAEVRELAARVAPELEGRPVEQAVLQLAALLTEARKQAARRQEMDRRLQGLDAEIREAEETVRAREARLAELRREARAEDDAGLDEAERRSAEAARLDAEIARKQEELLTAGEGAALDELEREAGEADPLALPGLLAELDARIEELERRNGDLRQNLGGLEGELARHGGGDEAARAAERAQEVLARLRGHVDQFVRVRLASVVLQREIERYRAENQDPLLRRAGELFAQLTLGRYTALRTDFDDHERPILVGVRDGGGRRVTVEGMSDGTRDQLYLSLRLATLERYLAHAEPLPFIVDDILINFDDDRTAATLKVLSELSKKTQVILFTHHARLKEMAAGMQNGAGVFVRELG